jgi:hypothetical protein
MNILPFIPMLVKTLVGKDVSKEVEAVSSVIVKKPLYLSRRFMGAILMSISGIVAIYMGVEIPEKEINTLADNLIIVIEVIMQNEAIWTGIYGAILSIVGYFKRKK